MTTKIKLKDHHIINIRPNKKICVFPIAWSSKLGSVGSEYAPSSKITQTCLFLSYYSLLIIWHAVQCFCYHLCVFSILYFYCWSRKQTWKRKWRRISGFCRSIFFLGIKNVRVGDKILGSVGRSEKHIFFSLA